MELSVFLLCADVACQVIMTVIAILTFLRKKK